RYLKTYNRRALELNGDLGVALSETLSGAQVKRYVRPTPVIDQKLESYKGLSRRFWSHIRFVAVSWHLLPVNCAGAVLTTRNPFRCFNRRGTLDRVKNSGLSTPNRISLKGYGRFHCRKGDQLQKMIGTHITRAPGPFVVPATLFDADFFRRRDLHTVDVSPIPNRLEDPVPEAKD